MSLSSANSHIFTRIILTHGEVLAILLGLMLAYVPSVAAAMHALLRKADPRSALGWVAVSLGLPLLGPLLYLLFGVNRIKTRAMQWHEQGCWRLTAADLERTERQRSPMSDAAYPYFDPGHLRPLLHLGDSVTRLAIVGPCRVEPLFDGERAYPEMLAAIQRARRYIYLSTYIFETDAVGLSFVEKLREARLRGVVVKILVDGVGALYSWPSIKKWLRRYELDYAFFLKPRLTNIHLNLRTHRKIIVIDGEIGFTGGMNIGGRHLVSHLKNLKRTQDVHFKITGPVLAHLQEAFLNDWIFAKGRAAEWGELIPPQLEELQESSVGLGGEAAREAESLAIAKPKAYCRGLISGPNQDFDKIRLVLLGAMDCSREELCVMTPYFIPDAAMIHALISAQLRGVRVKLILPQANNLPYVKWASQAFLPELLHYGVKVYYQPAPFCHSKYMLVDQSYSLIGSANLDPRSLLLNFEFNVEVYDPALNMELKAHFSATQARSIELSPELFRRQAFSHKLRDAAAKLMAPYL